MSQSLNGTLNFVSIIAVLTFITAPILVLLCDKELGDDNREYDSGWNYHYQCYGVKLNGAKRLSANPALSDIMCVSKMLYLHKPGAKTRPGWGGADDVIKTRLG